MELYDTCRNILKEALTRPKFSDPVKVCPIYNDHEHGSCAHVDSFLCDRNNCIKSFKAFTDNCEWLPIAVFDVRVDEHKQLKKMVNETVGDILTLYQIALERLNFNPMLGSPEVNKNLVKIMGLISDIPVKISQIMDIRMSVDADTTAIQFFFTFFRDKEETVQDIQINILPAKKPF